MGEWQFESVKMMINNVNGAAGDTTKCNNNRNHGRGSAGWYVMCGETKQIPSLITAVIMIMKVIIMTIMHDDS